MKFLRRLSLILTLLFFVLSAVIVFIDVIGDYYIIIGNTSSNQILSIFSSIAIVFFICYLALGTDKRLTVWICAILLSFTAAISLFIGVMPNYRYTEFVSEDKKHTLIVEEKMTSSAVYIRAYEHVDSCFYNSTYAITLSNKKYGTSYKYGDFFVAFEAKWYRVLVPLYSTTPIDIPYHKKSKTSE